MTRLDRELTRIGRATDALYPVPAACRSIAKRLAPVLDQAEHSLRLARACGNLGDLTAFAHLLFVRDACERALRQISNAPRRSRE